MLCESHRPGIEPATCKSQVQRPPAEQPRNILTIMTTEESKYHVMTCRDRWTASQWAESHRRKSLVTCVASSLAVLSTSLSSRADSSNSRASPASTAVIIAPYSYCWFQRYWPYRLFVYLTSFFTFFLTHLLPTYLLLVEWTRSVSRP